MKDTHIDQSRKDEEDEEGDTEDPVKALVRIIVRPVRWPDLHPPRSRALVDEIGVVAGGGLPRKATQVREG